METFDCQQRSDEWYELRRGVPTASSFKSVIATGRGGGPSLVRKKYMLTLAGEIITGQQTDNYSSWQMQRGRIMEMEAVEHYVLMTGDPVARVGFIKSGRIGCSPDGLVGESGMVEVKTCEPYVLIELRELVDRLRRFPLEHKAQVQGQLMVSEREWCDLVAYSTSDLYCHIRTHRDEEYIAMLQEKIEQFVEELDALVESIKRGETRYAFRGDDT